MKHHLYNPNFKFVIEPEEFDKYTERNILQYCLGATMYMPGTKDFSDKIIEKSMPGLTTIVMCFEDACPEEDVERAEENVCDLLDKIADAVENGKITKKEVPLIFCRIRNLDQFKQFSHKLNKERVRFLTGINFPKFNSKNGRLYLDYLSDLNTRFNDILYGMPIIEDAEVAYRESRFKELLIIKDILDDYKKIVLQVRVGATDFSSCFGVRRGVDYSIYDILTVRECLSDIVNVFGRQNEYVISGPVWEYFRASKEMMFKDLPKHGLEDYLLKRVPIINSEIDGLLREIILDKANGFIGRTVIHPSHVKFVNALMAVTKEEYNDACMILNSKKDGVLKGANGNKMNEIKPHTNWARKIYMRGHVYGVIENESEYMKLFAMNN